MKKIIFIILFLFISCNNENNNLDNLNKFPEIKEEEIITVYYRVKDRQDIYKEEYVKRCIEGHVYYIKHHYHQGYMAGKLDDNGKPVKCNINIKEN